MHNTSTSTTRKPARAQLAQIKAALRELHAREFQDRSSDPKYNAQRNLEGITHYTDEGTLSYFKSRILHTWIAGEGLLFALVESVNSRPDHGGENKRACLFDAFGTVIHQTNWTRTSERAEKDLREYIAGFDIRAHYTQEIKARAARMQDQAQRTRAALSRKAHA
jgi:hypothetical protein